MKKLIGLGIACLLIGVAGQVLAEKYINPQGNTVEEFAPVPREAKTIVGDAVYVLSDDGSTYIHLEWDAKGGARGTPLTPSEAAAKGLLAPAP